MNNSKINASILLFTTTACTITKSDEQIVTEICELMYCGDDSAEYLTEYLAECQSAGDEYFADLKAEGDCYEETRAYYICMSNLSCDTYDDPESVEDTCGPEAEKYYDCE